VPTTLSKIQDTCRPEMSHLRGLLLAAYAALFLVMLLGAVRVTISDDASAAMLEREGENYTKYSEYLDHFPSDIGAIAVFVNLLCTDAGWKLIQAAEQEFRSHPVVSKTSSIASPNARYITSGVDYIDLERFSDLTLDAKSRCDRAYQYEPFRDLLVSREGTATAIYLTAANNVGTEDFARSVTEIRDRYVDQARLLGGDILITGDPIMSTEIARVISEDTLYVLALILLLIVITYLITRSLKTCVASLCTIVFSLVGAFGFMGWVGLEITPGTALAIFLLGPLSAAFVIHAHGYVVRKNTETVIPEDAIIPTLFAGGTTALLFSCTGLTPAPDVQSLAILGVVGILFATLGAFLVAYPILTFRTRLTYAINFAIPRWALVRPWTAYLLLILFGIEIAIGLSKLRFEYEAIDYLPISNPTRAEFEDIGSWFGRMNIPLMITSEYEPDKLEVWLLLDQLERKVEKRLPGVHLASFHKQLMEVTKAATLDSDGKYLDFPNSSELTSQLLLLFDPEDYEDYIDSNNQRIVATFQVPFIGSADYFALKEVVEDHFSNTKYNASLVGRVSGFFESGHRIGIDNLKGLAIGGFLVFLFLLTLFKSLPLALIGLVVNAIPVLASLAALGLADVPIDLGSSIVTAIAFGIVVDDSTHLIVRIRRLQRSGYDPSTATIRAIRELIAPIFTTTAMTCLGFTVLFAAELQSFHDFATTILIAMSTALIGDLIILPTLVRTFVKDSLHSSARSPSS